MLFSILKKIKFKGKIDFIDYKGNKHSFGQAGPYSKVRFTNKSIERKLVRNPGLYLGEGYMNNEIVIEAGTIENFINVCYLLQYYFEICLTQLLHYFLSFQINKWLLLWHYLYFQ